MQILNKIEENINNQRIWKYTFCGVPYLVKIRNNDYHETKLCGFTLSKSQNVKTVFKNKLNINELFNEKKQAVKNKKIDIIIPVYNGYQYLPDLFNSIENNTDLDYRLIVVNDCSPDLKVKDFLQNKKEYFKSRMILINHDQNKGFVKSVNDALKLVENDTLLLNTDVILPKNWASRLFYPIFLNDKVASVTPFTNAAGIFSLPEINKDNTFDGDIEKINEAIKDFNIPYEKLKFSSGIGFCMAMSIKAIKDVGFLDEIFEKGYCEETDWCQRAIKKGYFNTIAGNLFVWHKHGGTFDSEERILLKENHLKILLKRYKHFAKDQKRDLHSNYFRSLRFIVLLKFLKILFKEDFEIKVENNKMIIKYKELSETLIINNKFINILN